MSWATVVSAHPALAVCEPDVAAAGSLLRAAVTGGNKILMCGNGGSAADCEHWSTELLKSYRRQRPVQRLPQELAEGLSEPIPALPLTSFSAFNSAFANDCDPVHAFAQLVLAYGRPGDVLCALSTSGRSPNVLRAAAVASATGLRVLALTGAQGDALAGLADVAVRAPSEDVSRTQELHLAIYHHLSLMLEAELFGATDDEEGTAGSLRQGPG